MKLNTWFWLEWGEEVPTSGFNPRPALFAI